VCPHSHVAPEVFADPDYSFGTPTDLFIIPDHYVYRVLYSQGISMESLGIPTMVRSSGLAETDHRRIWQVFADKFDLFLGTPTGQWIAHELAEVFEFKDRLTCETAQRAYDAIASQLCRPDFRPRALFDRFNIEVMCSTDRPGDSLSHHAVIRASGWHGRILPTFRPDNIINIDPPSWPAEVATLAVACGINIHDYRSLIRALEDRRRFFKEMGAVATDHSAITAFTEELSSREAEDIVQRGLKGEARVEDSSRFAGHMLIEMARMSTEDGLVMQLHTGCWRNHNRSLYQKFGPDTGADIPIAGEYTRNLSPLLNRHGNDRRLTLILFTLDEATYGRELAPLAGHYPALKLGPPWWFLDSPNGMSRYLDQVVEIAGLCNLAGFNDDTRAFFSIPARHDMWRRVCANWLAGLVLRHIVDTGDAVVMMKQLAYGLAKEAYRL
jgi:glucuronate isomerase